jgi:hypothetical protein
VNEYEPAGKIVLVVGLLGPPDMFPDAPPLIPLLFLCSLCQIEPWDGERKVRTYEEFLCRFLNPITSPTTKPTMHNAITIAITNNLFHPPRFAICLLFNTPCLAAASFSAFGLSPSSSNEKWLYEGGLS